MKRICKVTWIVLLMNLVLVFGALQVQAAVKSVKITNPAKKTATLTVGDKFQLKTAVTVTGKTSKKLTFTSSNKKVATVSAKGQIKAVGSGKATITVTSKADKKKKATIKVTVKAKSSQPAAPGKTPAQNAVSYRSVGEETYFKLTKSDLKEKVTSTQYYGQVAFVPQYTGLYTMFDGADCHYLVTWSPKTEDGKYAVNKGLDTYELKKGVKYITNIVVDTEKDPALTRQYIITRDKKIMDGKVPVGKETNVVIGDPKMTYQGYRYEFTPEVSGYYFIGQAHSGEKDDIIFGGSVVPGTKSDMLTERDPDDGMWSEVFDRYGNRAYYLTAGVRFYVEIRESNKTVPLIIYLKG